MPKSVYLVEDEVDLCSILTCFLSAAGFDVVPFSRGDQAIQAFQRLPPDLAVLDLMTAGCDGLELLKRLRAKSDCPVLLISDQATEIDRVLGLELGADDYLPKPFSARELVARVKALFRRLERQQSAAGPRPDRGLSYRTLHLDLDRKTLGCGSSEASLTLSEFFILSKMMAQPSKTFARAELLEPPVVYRGGDSRAVDMHIANLRKKVAELQPGFVPLLAVRGVGYRMGY
jgi:DNA-binding response OmpR family regulator